MLNFAMTRHITTNFIGRKLTVGYYKMKTPAVVAEKRFQNYYLFAQIFDREFPVNPWRIFRKARLDLNNELKHSVRLSNGSPSSSVVNRLVKVREMLANYDRLTGHTLVELPKGVRTASVPELCEQLDAVARDPEAYDLPKFVVFRGKEKYSPGHQESTRHFLLAWKQALETKFSTEPFRPSDTYPSDFEHWVEIRKMYEHPLPEEETEQQHDAHIVIQEVRHPTPLVFPTTIVADKDPLMRAAGISEALEDFQTKVELTASFCVNSEDPNAAARISAALQLLESDWLTAEDTSNNYLTITVREKSLNTDSWNAADHTAAYHRLADRMERALSMIRALLDATDRAAVHIG